MVLPRGCSTSGDIGIAEAYLHGQWDTPDLTHFLYLFCVNHELIQSMLGGKPLVRFVQMVRHWFNRNTRRASAAQHPRALRPRQRVLFGVARSEHDLLVGALRRRHARTWPPRRHNKYRRLAEAIDLQPGQNVLEIGCGWGGFAEYRRQDLRRQGRRADDQQRAARLRPQAHSGGGPRRQASRSGCRTIATSAATTTASHRSR